MGVDFYICNRCSDTFPDCGDYEQCDCGRHWCSEYCATEEGLIQSDYDPEEGYRENHCSFCRGEAADDEHLLKYALKLLKMSREKLEKKYLEKK